MGEGTQICNYYCSNVCTNVAVGSLTDGKDSNISIYSGSGGAPVGAWQYVSQKLSAILSSWGKSFSAPSSPAQYAKALASDWNALVYTAPPESFTYNNLCTSYSLGNCSSFTPATSCSGVSYPATGSVDVRGSAVSAETSISQTTYINKLNAAKTCSTFYSSLAPNTTCSSYCACVIDCGCVGYCPDCGCDGYCPDCGCDGYCSIDSCGLL